jgi:hypothetical protein
MTTSSITHRRASYAAAVTGLVGTLLALTLNNASAMPGRDDHPTVPADTAHTHGHYVEHSCFITPHTWNEALAGPLPRCYTWVA